MTSKQLDHTNEQELILKYLEDTLTSEEEMLVADLYESDKVFRDALDGLEMLTADQFSNTLNSLSARIDSKIQSSANVIEHDVNKKDNVRQLFSSGTSMRRMAIAASLALCLLFGGTIFMNQWQSPTDRMFASNFENKPHPDPVVRGPNALSQAENLAITAYSLSKDEDENYEIAVERFRALFEQYPESEKHGLFLGISLMGDKEYQEAISILEGLQPIALKYTQDIDWYLALCYIKVKDLDGARSLLITLSNDTDSYYQEPSANLLKNKRLK